VPLLVVVMQLEDVVPGRQDCKAERKLDLLANLPDDTLSCAPFYGRPWKRVGRSDGSSKAIPEGNQTSNR
jgi:hypothetical protein